MAEFESQGTKPASADGTSPLAEQLENLIKIDNLASAQYRSGNFKDAADLLRRALTIREEFMAADDIDLLNNVNNLAASLGRLRKFDDAEVFFRRVLLGREEKLGKDHMDTLVTANHLGVVVKQQHKLLEAEPYLVRALQGLKLVERSLPANGLLYAEAAYNYAVLCVQLGRRKQAAKYFGIAHKRLEKTLGAENPHTLDALHWEIKCMKDVDFKPTNSTAGGAGVKTGTTTVEPGSAAASSPEKPSGGGGTGSSAAAATPASSEADALLADDSADADTEMYLSKPTWVSLVYSWSSLARNYPTLLEHIKSKSNLTLTFTLTPL